MADIRPLRGLHYNLEKIGSLKDVIAPPYDVISPEQKTALNQKSQWNVVRLILPDGENPYEHANQLLHSWIDQGILINDPQPSIYCYHQKFTTPDGEEKTRKGFMARVRVEDFEKGIILPHEATLFAPKEDRLNLLRACHANFSPIFGLYSDPEQQIDAMLDAATAVPADASVADENGIINSLWIISDPTVIEAVQEKMKQHWVLIADGHHRYESCLVYRNEMREKDSDPEAPFNFTLMFFTNIDHPGIAVLPYNRAISGLPHFDPNSVMKKAEKYFVVHEFDEEPQAQNALKKASSTTAFLALIKERRGYHLFKLKPHVKLHDFYPEGTPEVVQRLDVNILHRIFIHGILGITEEEVQKQTYIKYYKDSKEEKKDFESGRLQIAFFLNPTRVEQVVEVSRAGEKMPQKSTFFYPKLMTGFVINQHETT